MEKMKDLAAAREWQPMDSAPKDGTFVLLYGKTWGIQKAFWYEDFFDPKEDKTRPMWMIWQSDDDLWYYDEFVNPECWMPVPDPPKAATS